MVLSSALRRGAPCPDVHIPTYIHFPIRVHMNSNMHVIMHVVILAQVQFMLMLSVHFISVLLCCFVLMAIFRKSVSSSNLTWVEV